MGVAVTFFELLKSLFALFDQMWVVYVWHGCIVPSKTGNGISKSIRWMEVHRNGVATK